MVGEVGEPERSAFDALQEIVGRFGGGVDDPGLVPGSDLGSPNWSRPTSTMLAGPGLVFEPAPAPHQGLVKAQRYDI